MRAAGGGPTMEFDVYGYRVIVERHGDRWVSFEPGDDGKRRASWFEIPPDLPEADLEQYLADLFHEGARPDRSEVKRLR